MSRSQAEQKLKEMYRGRKGLQDAFHEELAFVQFHLEYIEEQCGGAWNDEKAEAVFASLSRGLN